jgi:hypothetical protein
MFMINPARIASFKNDLLVYGGAVAASTVYAIALDKLESRTRNIILMRNWSRQKAVLFWKTVFTV